MRSTLDAIKALADGNRLRVVVALAAHDELCVCQITELLQLATATVSRHMSILHGAQLIESRKDGRWVYHRLSSSFPAPVLQWLVQSIGQSAPIKDDRQRLAEILSCDTAEICKKQKGKRP
jgi:ArsR family transcriptional regulator